MQFNNFLALNLGDENPQISHHYSYSAFCWLSTASYSYAERSLYKLLHSTTARSGANQKYHVFIIYFILFPLGTITHQKYFSLLLTHYKYFTADEREYNLLIQLTNSLKTNDFQF
tara:strand:+ start:562 stop:906 length:345 start_codon:yes stop_codon:yes gene_type:complete